MTIAAVALASVFGGQQYLYCRAMGEVMARGACECGQREVAEGYGASLVVFNDCFDVRFLDRLLSTSGGGNLVIAGPSLVAVLPANDSQPHPAKAVVQQAEHPIRAGPYSPAAVRARLMVFLT